MAIITVLSNITIIPSIILMHYQHRYFTFYLSISSFITSCMYHLGESLDIKIFLPQLKWHELDNIYAIYSLNCMFLGFNRFVNDLKFMTKLNYFNFFMILIYQQKGPWIVSNTVKPFIIAIIVTLYLNIRYGREKINKAPLIPGGILCFFSLIIFVRGLDDLNDYLRIYHSLWHVLIGASSFYLWQLHTERFVTQKEMLIYAKNNLFAFRNKGEKILP